jgi:N,N'-diacetyllegionaminate synthase
MRTLIIAEAGVNHNGDIELAKKLIDVAADAGADLVKFQTFSADRLVTQSALKAEYQVLATDKIESQYEMLRKLELTESMHHELINHCTHRKIGFFSTGFDTESLNLLASLGQDLFKIPSGEITNLPFLQHVARIAKSVILSTGMSSMEEIDAAISVLEKSGITRSSITVLHCTSAYPTPAQDVNLHAMLSIKNAFNVSIGYSDHTLGIEVPIAAVALGASVIEKHFTLDKNLPGPDHMASLDPSELISMISAIRKIEVALGDGLKRLMPSEAMNVSAGRKVIVAKRFIKKGEELTSLNITTKRSSQGVSPMKWDTAIGSKASRDYSVDENIELEC